MSQNKKLLIIAVLMTAAIIGFALYRMNKQGHSIQHATPSQVQGVAAKEANDRLDRQQKELANGTTLANDLLDLTNARLENDIAELKGRPKQNGKIARAQAKVDADERLGYSTNWHGLVDLSSKSSMTESLMIQAMLLDCGEASLRNTMQRSLHNRGQVWRM